MIDFSSYRPTRSKWRPGYFLGFSSGHNDDYGPYEHISLTWAYAKIVYFGALMSRLGQYVLEQFVCICSLKIDDELYNEFMYTECPWSIIHVH